MTEQRRTRAEALPPEERRDAILNAALPLLLEHGRATTTKQIACAAGIAEGTIFRVFASKEDLFDAALHRAFDSEGFLADIEAVAAQPSLRARMIAMTTVMQTRFSRIFELMAAMAAPTPGRDQGQSRNYWRDRVMAEMAALLAPWEAEFRIPVSEVVVALRLLTFSGSHPHIADQRLPADQIVDVILHGTTKEAARCCCD